MIKRTNVIHIGKNIQYVRKEICHMTQYEFAESINLSFEQLQKIEQGTSGISVPSLLAIADYTGTPIDFLRKQDIDSSNLYSILFLIKEIEKYDKSFIENLCEMLLAVYIKVRTD